jgi:hypothetical protein
MEAMHNRRPEERRDPQFKPLRNRFKPLCQRRVDINNATEGDLMERIPGVGKEKGPSIRSNNYYSAASMSFAVSCEMK